MRRSTALVTAAALGFGTALAACLPAAALPVGGPAPDGACENLGQHAPTTNIAPWDDSFYDCVPQYGAGKVAFTIDSDEDYPDDFDLANPDITRSSSTLSRADLRAYFGPSGSAAGFLDLSGSEDFFVVTQSSWAEALAAPAVTTADAPLLAYIGLMAFPITSVEKLDETTPPAECLPGGTETYNAAYRFTYGDVTTSFRTEIDDVLWKHDVTATPEPLELYLNLEPGTGSFDSGFVADAPQCATSGSGVLVASSDADSQWSILIITEGLLLSPFPLDFFSEVEEEALASITIGEFAGVAVDLAADDAELAELAETGTGSVPAGTLGAAVALLAGGLLLGARRRAARRAARV